MKVLICLVCLGIPILIFALLWYLGFVPTIIGAVAMFGGAMILAGVLCKAYDSYQNKRIGTSSKYKKKNMTAEQPVVSIPHLSAETSEQAGTASLHDLTEYAVRFQSDSGMIDYLVRNAGKLSNEERGKLEELLQLPKDTIRNKINEMLSSAQGSITSNP